MITRRGLVLSGAAAAAATATAVRGETDKAGLYLPDLNALEFGVSRGDRRMLQPLAVLRAFAGDEPGALSSGPIRPHPRRRRPGSWAGGNIGSAGAA
ncbi:hypothetical protein CSW64_19510 [Caulobacter mirabilis]|uniref:Uncharacterized protein n=1 Tax=Caulobacter mirabilis TaxID=69666 RepID=A0A2D2B2H7_9CAUL|nr:hypothetical protein CSW64_19510 [Caulobacter mirabilis]